MDDRTWQIVTYAPWWKKPREDGESGRWVPGFRPVALECDFAKLVRGLTTFRLYPTKEQAWCWSPVVLSEPHRKSDNVRWMTCLVADLDTGGRTLEEQARPVVDAGWVHIVHSSWRYTPEVQKGRLILPLEAPIPAEYIPRAWKWLQSLMGGAADEQCKDLGRLYFLPSYDGTPERRAVMRSWVGCEDGKLLDLRPFDALPLVREPPPGRVYEPTRVRDMDAAAREVRRRLATDPTARARAAHELGATLHESSKGTKAKGIRCPGCGRSSVWFMVVGNTAQGARCEHRKSCGWTGLIEDLL